MPEPPPTCVVDASIVVKWLLPLADEPHNEIAGQVVKDGGERRTRLLAVDHIAYEVGHALRRAIRRERLVEEQGRRLFQRFHSLALHMVGDADLRLQAWDLASHYGCSFYDATYLALARRQRVPFVHADDRLRALLQGQFAEELWIEDYLS